MKYSTTMKIMGLVLLLVLKVAPETLAFTPAPMRSIHSSLETLSKRSTTSVQVQNTEMIEEIDDLIEDMEGRSIWEQGAKVFVGEDFAADPATLKTYTQLVTLFRVGVPAIGAATFASLTYPFFSMQLAEMINDAGAFDVIANDYSQYFQNILTTCGLTFSILLGYTYYFLYQQQEAIFFALFDEVNVAKTLLEQVSLVSQGRRNMHQNILACIDRYVKEDLTQFSIEPSVLLSARPIDDPMEEIMYMTSVGEPSVIYQTVRSLRQARAARLGALQRKLPPIQIVLLWTLASVVLSTFSVLGAGVQTLGGPGILHVYSYYLGFITFGIFVAMGIVGELQQPAGKGAYSAIRVLTTMVEGLEEELESRQQNKYISNGYSPSVDGIPVLENDDEIEIVLPANDKAVHGDAKVGIGRRIARRFRRHV